VQEPAETKQFPLNLIMRIIMIIGVILLHNFVIAENYEINGRYVYSEKDSIQIIELYNDFEFAIHEININDTTVNSLRGHYKQISDTVFFCSDFACNKVLQKSILSGGNLITNSKIYKFSENLTNILNGRYIGYWADTEWTYEFYSQFSIYILKTSGHYGWTVNSFKYVNKNDTIFVNSSPLFIYQKSNDCIIEISIKMDYCKKETLSDIEYYIEDESNPVYTNYSFSYKKLKYPYLETSDSLLINNSESVLNRILQKPRYLSLLIDNDYKIVTELPGLNANLEDKVIINNDTVSFHKGYYGWMRTRISDIYINKFSVNKRFGFVKIIIYKNEKYKKRKHYLFKFGKYWVCV